LTFFWTKRFFVKTAYVKVFLCKYFKGS